MPYCLSSLFIGKDLNTEFSGASCFGIILSHFIVNCVPFYSVEVGMLKLDFPESLEASNLNAL